MEVKKIRDLNPYRYCDIAVGGKDRYVEYKNLFLNNITITKKDGSLLDYPIESFIKNTLFEEGSCGYDKALNIPFKVINTTNDKNVLGNPIYANIRYGNNKKEKVKLSYNKEGEFYLLNAFIDTFALSTIIKDSIDEINLYHSAKVQNIRACKTPYIIKCKNGNVRRSLLTAIEQQQDNKPVIVVDSSIGDGLVSIKTNVDFIADKYDELEDKAKDKLFNKLGIMSANINKKERVQVGEVNATLGQCLDYIYTFIDTFNKQCETYGIDLVMVDNTSLYNYEEKESENIAKEGKENE